MDTQQEHSTHVVRGVVCALCGGVSWGFSGTCAQLLTSGYGIPVVWITCVRIIAAAGIYLVLTLLFDRKKLFAVFRDRRSLARIAVFAVLGVLMTQISYLSTISYTDAGTGTVLERLGLILIMAYVCIRVKRWPYRRELIGLGLAIVGTVLIATQGNIGALAIPPEALGWGAMVALSLAFYTLLPGKAVKKWGSFVVTALAMMFASVLACVFIRPWTIEVQLDPFVVAVLAAMVLVGTVGAYLLYLQGIADAGPMRAGLVGSIEPVAATTISAVWLGTPVSAMDVIGMLMIVAMVLLVTQREGIPEKGQEAAGGEDPVLAFDASTDDLPLFEGEESYEKK